jgi:putative flavoprotein involved in K+ transport
MPQQQLSEKRHFRTIVIGAGQAGLAAGFYLKELNEDFLIIDEASEIGQSWHSRWDSLKLFTPDWYNGLPGMPFPKTKGKFPGKDAMGQYLRDYAAKYKLPIRLNTKVNRLSKDSAGFTLHIGNDYLTCTNAIVATGNFSIPRIPTLAAELNPAIRQIHSSDYRNPSQLPNGKILVVGAATSGLQIALDLATSGRLTYVAGLPPQQVPDFAVKYLSWFFLWFMTNVLTVKTKLGRKTEHQIKREGKAAPLINISLKQVLTAGVIHLPRLETIMNGYPSFFNNDRPDSGQPIEVDGIVWCTGYDRDLSWIDMDRVTDEQGYPLTNRGVATHQHGLYFMGMLFQYALASVMVGGVGRDARFVANHIHKNAL